MGTATIKDSRSGCFQRLPAAKFSPTLSVKKTAGMAGGSG